jgi:feruloyl esterase
MLEQCEKFAVSMAGRWPDPSTRISSTQYYDAAQEVSVPMFGSPPLQVVVPAHCEVRGQLRERAGALGQQYAIRFHLRLPTVWNHRFYFQGGGGTNGDLGNALACQRQFHRALWW